MVFQQRRVITYSSYLTGYNVYQLQLKTEPKELRVVLNTHPVQYTSLMAIFPARLVLNQWFQIIFDPRTGVARIF